MTTKVTVEANHGWPVKVIPVNPKTGEWYGNVREVPAGAIETFYIHSDQDLIIHEIQPDEKKDAN